MDDANAAPLRNRVSAMFSPVSRRLWFSAIAAVLACLVVYGFEYALESLLASEERGNSPLTSSIFELSGLYQRVVTVGWRKPAPTFTVIVEINPETDSTLRSLNVNNVCDQRRFLANLIATIATNHPAVIVLDKYFGRDACLSHPDGTAALQASIKQASVGVPIVVGRHAAHGKNAEHSDGEVHLDPALMFDGGLAVVEGIVNIHRDTRRMALRWCGVVD